MSQVPPPMGGAPLGYQTPGPSKPQGMAIAALICGILSIVLVCVNILSIPLGIAAIVLGMIGGQKARRGEAGGEGLAKTGMILGIAGVALAILLTILAYAGMSFLGNKARELEQEMQRQQQMDQSGGTTETDTTGTDTTTTDTETTKQP